MKRTITKFYAIIGGFLLLAACILKVSGGGSHLEYSFSSDGKLTTEFGTIFNPRYDDARAVATVLDGKIVVAGGSSGDFAVARYNADGTLDTSFGGDGKVITDIHQTDIAYAVAMLTNGKVVIAGTAAGDFTVIRYNEDGSLDTSFGGDGIVTIDFNGSTDVAHGITVMGDGRIVVVGSVTSASNDLNWGIARLNTNGSLDTTFDGNGILATDFNGGNDVAQDVAVQADSKIVVVGYAYTNSLTAHDFAIARYSSNGALDTTFNEDGKTVVNVGDGLSNDFAIGFERTVGLTYTLAGRSTVGGIDGTSLVRLTSDGLLDTTFNGDGKIIYDLHFGYEYATDIALVGNGKMVVTYAVLVQYTADMFGVARFNPDGSLDPTFGTGGKINTPFGTGDKRRANAVAYQPVSPGGVIVAGSYQSGTDLDFAVARYRIDHSAAPADYTRDGQADFAVFRPSTGVTWILNTENGSNSAAQFGTSGDVPAPGDYDRDARTDIAIYRPSEGNWYVLRSSNSSYYSVPFGLSTDKPTQGDFDGDGFTDTAVFRPSTGVWYIHRTTDDQIVISQFGTSEDKPAQADFDGDGLADIAVFRPSNGVWYLQRSNLGFTATQFGISGDRPVPADFDADGRADIAVWRPSTGVWYSIQSETNSTNAIQFGTSGDIPGPADFDKDGRADLTVFRPSTGVWYVQKSTGGYNIVGFGLNGDIPLLARYVPE